MIEINPLTARVWLQNTSAVEVGVHSLRFVLKPKKKKKNKKKPVVTPALPCVQKMPEWDVTCRHI